ncbi:MAG: glycosyltransferase family 4 protein [Acidimicrobiaceae bacterium]|nr:glycosyltransferase family 4 protein [Acidimicrobiaceae bacterium]
MAAFKEALGEPLRVGLYSPFFGSTLGGGEKYLGVAAAVLRDTLPSAVVELTGPVAIDVPRYERQLGLDFHGITVRSTLGRPGMLARRLARIEPLRRYRDLVVSSRTIGATAAYDLFLSMVYVVPAFTRARRSVILCQFPYELTPSSGAEPAGILKGLYRWPERALRPRLLGRGVDDFDLVVCQSDYVQEWVARRWHRGATVVNPPIDVPGEEPDWTRKEPMILGVGRFFARGHSKRQDLMVRAFRELCDEGLSGWTLQLVGGLQRDHAEDVAFFDRVVELAKGYPVGVHTDVSGEVLRDLYRRSPIYWHAAGFDVDGETHPEDLEHFGMTTAEAMGHGAVPVAIGRGGQVEVVETGISGFLWDDIEQMKARTLQLVGSSALRLAMGAAARNRSMRFSRTAFGQNLIAALLPVLTELEAGPELRLAPGGCQP